MNDPTQTGAPDGEPAASEESGFPLPPWGLIGTLLGIALTLNLAQLLGALVLWGSGVSIEDVDEASWTVRYALAGVFQLAFVVIPFAALALVSKVAGAAESLASASRHLGFRWCGRIAALESFFVGLILIGVTPAYDWLLMRFAPAAHAAFQNEQAQQMEILGGSPMMLVLIVVWVAPFAEELFFRGFVFGGIRRLGFPLASGLSAALFAGAHFMAYSTIPLFVFGLATATLYERHRTVVAAMIAHASYNLTSVALSL